MSLCDTFCLIVISTVQLSQKVFKIKNKFINSKKQDEGHEVQSR